MIHYRCPTCGGALSNSEAAAGMTISCRHCGTKVEVPSSGTARPEPDRSSSRRPETASPDAEPMRPLVDSIGGLIGAHAADTPPVPLTTGKRVLYSLLGLFLFAIFGGMGVYGGSAFVESQASQNWPSVAGRVEQAGVAETVERDSRGRRRTEYRASVRYAYTVGEKEYENARIGFGDGQNYSFLARALADRFPPEQKVTVYYNPGNPQEAVLLREVMFSAYLMVLVGILGGYVGLRLLLVSLTPTLASTNSRWLPWSHRFTWIDLPITLVGVIGLVLWLPMLFGL